MVMRRLTMRTFGGLTLWAGFALSAQAQLPAVKVDEALKVLPRQPGVNVSTPTPDQIPQCRVDPIPNATNPQGYVVRDPAGRPVRQFVSYDGKNFNALVFFVNGVEAYREFYPDKGPYQFRWLGPNGSKWGLSKGRNARIDEWVAISPEELSQELLQAVLTRDETRAEALVVTKANLDAIGIPAGDAQKLLTRAGGVRKNVTDAANALKAGPDARWLHLNLGIPQTTAADSIGAKDDLVAYKNGTVLLEAGPGNPKFLQIGEIVQIGRAWKLVDGPVTNAGEPGGPPMPDVPPEIASFVTQLQELDSKPATTAQAQAEINGQRVGILEQIVAKLPAEKHETWQRLLIDALANATEGEKPDGKHLMRLKQIKEALEKGSNGALTATASYRFILADYNVASAMAAATNDGRYAEVQEKYRGSLDAFAKAFPNSEEAPDALLRLAMALEYVKDGDGKAKETYTILTKNYAKYPHATKAAGAIKRLGSVGQPYVLIGTALVNPKGPPLNTAALNGRVMVVYYWASWGSNLQKEVETLQAIMKTYGSKGLELVTVCLDNEPGDALKAITEHKIPGHHVHEKGGLDNSPLAASYGINVVPHLFIVGKDGKVINRNAQIISLEEEVKKLVP